MITPVLEVLGAVMIVSVKWLSGELISYSVIHHLSLGIC